MKLIPKQIEGGGGLGATITPAKAPPVSLQRKVGTLGTMQEENHDWVTFLADGVGRRCVGRDPMSIPLEVLTASGHPKRSTAKLKSAFIKGTGGDCHGLEGVRVHSDIRRHVCLHCVEGDAEVRHCTTINCPFWPYRMGRNPHNAARGRNAGINPFNQEHV